MNTSDQQLVISYLKRGEENLLKILIKKYLKPIYNFVYQYVNNPLETQDVTRKLLSKPGVI